MILVVWSLFLGFACLGLWEKYIGNPGSGELESSMGVYFIRFVISFLLLSSQIFNHSMQNYLKQGSLKYPCSPSFRTFGPFVNGELPVLDSFDSEAGMVSSTRAEL